jgi:chloramphenicol 3-O-phosphotransferase
MPTRLEADRHLHSDFSTVIQGLLEAVTRGPEAVRPLLSGSIEPEKVIDLLAPVASAPGLRMDEPRVNGRRVDLSAYSETGQEWCVVLRVSGSPSTKVENVSVFERPAPFAGIPGGFVIVVRGPSSSGKSTLMAALGDLADTPWIRFDETWVGELPLRFLIWPEASGPIAEGFLAALPALARAGNQIITSSGAFSEEQFRSALTGIPSLFVRLECPLAVLVERQQQRVDRWAGLAEETARESDDWSYDLRIDTSANDPIAAARTLIQVVGKYSKRQD